MRRIHFIAIGGAAMHNLAIALHQKGYKISGSDDEIFEPSRTRLAKLGLLPDEMGWQSGNVTKEIDAVILGMHARADNPELVEAQMLGIPIYSYPEFLYKQTENKKRIVIAGSHGKTTITAMVVHVLKFHDLKFDYMVGSQIDGFENMVGLSDDSDYAIFEGDEYLSSPLDLRPKFMHYRPHVVLISGIAWDHINVFPTFEKYVQQFENLIGSLQTGSKLYYYAADEQLQQIVPRANQSIVSESYTEHPSRQYNGQLELVTENDKGVPIKVFGKHNLQNLNGARLVCGEIGITSSMFYEAISSFGGTAKRLQLIHQQGSFNCYLDFAHSPSKVKATVEAVRQQYPNRKLVAVFELHTFSSLNKQFIPQYKHCFTDADEAVIYFNRTVLEHKKMEDISPAFIKGVIDKPELQVITDVELLQGLISSTPKTESILLLMSSGSFSGIDIAGLIK